MYPPAVIYKQTTEHNWAFHGCVCVFGHVEACLHEAREEYTERERPCETMPFQCVS